MDSQSSTSSKSSPCPPRSDDDILLAGVPQLPLEFLLKSVMPPVSDAVCSRIQQHLVETKDIVNGHWSTPRGTITSTSEPLDSLNCIFQSIVDAIPEMEQTEEMIMSAKFVLASCDPSCRREDHSWTCKHRTHAEFQPLSGTKHEMYPHLSTAIPCRYYEDSDGGPSDLVQDCHTVLRKDSRRRFIFGITVNDDDDLRIWFFSRTHSFVSEPLNIFSKLDMCIRFFIAVAFGTLEQLGYDDSMSCFIDDAGIVQYKLVLDATVYVTMKLLSDHRADTISGRSTRVWEAYQEGDPERVPVVVKDLWMPADAAQEGNQLLELREKLRALEEPGTPLPPGDYFLTVLAHGFVRTSDGADDHTLDVVMRGCLPPVKSAQRTPRKHYRIVFKEVGVPIDRLSTISEIMHALADATRALSLLHRLGLVHRDVSTENVLLANGVGKLSDLEYMKSYKELSPPDPDDSLVGTREFTAVEAALGNYWFIPSDFSQEDPMPPWPFRFNPLHDLESTMWIGVWAVLFYRQHDRILAQYYVKYFTNFIDPILRFAGLTSAFPRLPPSDPLYEAIDALRGVRARLRQHYAKFEANLGSQEDPNRPHIDIQDIHAQFIGRYEDAASRLEGTPCFLPPKETPRGPEKRPEVPESSIERASPTRKRKSSESHSAGSTKKPDGSGRSTDSRKRHSSRVHPTRRSSRIAEARKKTRGL